MIQGSAPHGDVAWKETSAEVLEARFYSIKSSERFALWQMAFADRRSRWRWRCTARPFLITLGAFDIPDPNATKSIVTGTTCAPAQKRQIEDGRRHARRAQEVFPTTGSAAANAIDTGGGSLRRVCTTSPRDSPPRQGCPAHEPPPTPFQARPRLPVNADAYMHRQALLPACS